MIPNSLHPIIPEKPVDIIEVFFDDFIGAKDNAYLTHILHLSRCILHVIRAIPTPSEVTQYGGGDSVSENNLNKGEGTWSQEK